MKDLVSGPSGVHLEHTQLPVHLAAVVQARDRLLARVAALRERDVRLRQARFGGENRVVDLLPPRRSPGLDPEPLELLVGEGRLDVLVEQLGGRLAVLAVRDASVLAEDDDRPVLLGLDFHLRGKPGAQQCRLHRLPESGLGEKQEVVLAAADHDDRSDHARLRGQEQRLAGRGGDVVRHHALQEVLRVRPGDPDKHTRPEGNSARNGSHPH
jgi:hypothetical protein